MQSNSIIIPDHDDPQTNGIEKGLNHRRHDHVEDHWQRSLLDQRGAADQRACAEIYGPGKRLPGDNAAQGEQVVIRSPAVKDHLDHKIVNEHQKQWIKNPPQYSQPGGGHCGLDIDIELTAQGMSMRIDISCCL